MKKEEMLALNPQEYLAGGFFDSDGELRERMDGDFSLAMAYRLEQEGVKPEQIKKITDKLEQIFEKNAEKIEADPDGALNNDAYAILQDANNDSIVSSSPTLAAIFDGARPCLKDWRNFSAFVLHLQRIAEQIEILESV